MFFHFHGTPTSKALTALDGTSVRCPTMEGQTPTEVNPQSCAETLNIKREFPKVNSEKKPRETAIAGTPA